MTTKSTKTIECEILSISPLRLSAMGNPRYRVCTTAGSFTTKANASVAYGIPNLFGYDRSGEKARQRKSAILHLTPAGYITNITFTDGSHL